MLTIKVTGQDGVAKTLARIVPASEEAVLELAERIHELAYQGADKHTKNGALIDSLGHGPKRIPGGWEIGHNRQRAPHAAFVHWGTKPHVIRPKNKKALRYVDKDGRFVFWFGPKSQAGRVMAMEWLKKAGYPTGPGGVRVRFRWPKHPGYKGDPWLTRAADTALREFDGIVQSTLNKRL